MRHRSSRASSRPWLSTPLVLLLATMAVVVGLATAIPASKLAAAIDAIIAQPQFDRSEWGLLVVRANTTTSSSSSSSSSSSRSRLLAPGDVLYHRNAEQYFTPASNNKVPTTAAAFVYFGPNHTLATRVSSSTRAAAAAATAARASNLDAVCIQGAGDASFSTNLQLARLAQQLYATGVRTIDSLLFNDLLFPPEPPATWEWDDLQAAYGARPNSLILDENALRLTIAPTTEGAPPLVLFNNAADNACVTVVNTAQTLAKGTATNLVVGYRLGSSALQVSGVIGATSPNSSFVVAALDPAQRFMCAANYMLAQQGISVKSMLLSPSCGTNSSLAGQPVWYELFTIKSPQLRYTMNYTLQESNNLYAECTLRSLGAEYKPPLTASHNAEQNGIAAVSAILASAGVDVTAFKQFDGSGLSRHDLMSPQAMVEVFKAMQAYPEYKTFLPVAGESGTLKNRFVGTTAQGIVHAKTGTVSGVTSLSGYVDNPALPVIFSIIVNFSNQPSSVIRQGVDDIVVLLSQLTQG